MKSNTRAMMLGLSMALGLIVMFNTSDAHAKGVAIINTGTDVTEIAPIEGAALAKVKEDTGAANPAIGYQYELFGLFWIDVWTWDGKFVIFEDDKSMDLTPEIAKEYGIDMDSLSKPFTYSVPPGLIIIVVLGILFLVFTFFIKGKDDDEETTEEKPAEE